MATTPAYVSAPRIGAIAISSANTNRDGTTGAYGTVIATLSNPTRVERLRVVATSTTTAGTVRVFISDGSTVWLVREIAVTAITPSASVQVFSYELAVSDLVLPTGWSMKASTHNAEGFNVFAFGGEIA